MFEQVHDCFEVFKLNTILNGCIVRQVFGCDTRCTPQLNYDGSNMLFILPEGYQPGSESPFIVADFFYNEAGVLVAYTYDEFLDYMRNLDGISAVDDIDISGIDCTPYAAFSITGSGYIPTSFYYGVVQQSNRVFGVVISDIDEICNYVPVTCDKPVFGTIDVEEDDCDSPAFGTIEIEDMSVDLVTITGFGDWTDPEGDSTANIYNYLVTFSLSVFNETLPNVDSPPQVITIHGDIIGVIGAEARPTTNVALDSTNSNMPADTAIVIEPTGIIRYTGEPTLSDGTGSYITLTDISYNTTV